MKKIIQIARLELSLLFYSPIAWLILIILFVQMSLQFTGSIPGIERQSVIPGLTVKLFTKEGFFSSILESLYLYIPLITMGIISRETSSGSIKLLYSSPVKLSQVVYGKFTAMLIYNLIILGVMSLFVISGALFIDNFDYSNVLVALLAIYLLLSAYSAIGIFVSSLTTYQTIAAISTFVVLAVLNYIGTVGQGLDFIRDITYSVSMPHRAKRMIGGLLNTRDLCYYLVIIGMFLALTITRLELTRVSKSALYQAGRYMMIVIISLTITFFTSRQAVIGYYDATANKANTISKAEQEILKQMGEGPVEMTEYINGLESSYYNGAPDKRIPDIERWEPYLRFKPNINLKWVYYYDSIPGLSAGLVRQKASFRDYAFTMARLEKFDLRDFLSPGEIQKQIDLFPEDKRLVMQLKYKDKTSFLRTYNDVKFWPDPDHIAAALKKLMVTSPKIVFATDGYQRSMDKMGDHDYKVLLNSKLSRPSLINHGFEVDSVSLEQGEIPANIAALVIADPRVIFTEVAKAKLRKYIAEGGNLMIVGEPGKQDVINPLLDSLGVNMLNGTILQPSRDYSSDLVTPALAVGAVAMEPGLQPYYSQGWGVSMPGVAALSYKEEGAFTVHPLLMTNEQISWIKKGEFVLDSAAIEFNADKGDQRGAFPTALSLTRVVKGKEQRIIVASDADFFSNAEMGRINVGGIINFNFAVSIFSWFAYDEFPIDVSRMPSKDNSTTLTKTSVKVIQVLYYGVIPGIMFLTGLILLIRRKRK